MLKRITFLFLFLTLFYSAFATHYYVKPDGDDNNTGTSWETAFKTLTKVVSVTVSADEVWVAKGTYQEGNTIEVSQGVSLYGGFNGTEENLDERDIENNQTIIDGNNSYRCVKNKGIIDGFYITKGLVGEDVVVNAFGGGIYNDNGTVANCIIYMNKVTIQTGGGIYTTNGIITNCIVHSNSARGSGGITNGGSIIKDCIIYNNNSATHGGGIFSVNGFITNCIIYNNTASWRGGGIISLGDTITNCIIYNNRANYYGGGIQVEPNYSNICNCTVYHNYGGGICINIDGITNPLIITNSISWNNESYDITGNGTINYSCFGEAVEGVDNNIKSEPLFINTSGDVNDWDFHLQVYSPCIDAGCYRGDVGYDIEGNLRGYDLSSELRGDGSNFDMGAYEYIPKKYYVDDDNTSGPWYGKLEHPFMKIQDGIDAAVYKDTIIVLSGYYLENIRFEGKNITVQSNNPTDSSVVSNTIIDGNHWGSTVIFNGSELANCILSGFTIKNGFARAGGGICGNGTQASIQNNRITENMCYVNIPYGDFGAGIFGCDGLIENNVIDNNFANYAGGGLAYCDGRIWNNVISGNSASEGGGFAFCDGDIQNSTVYGNFATNNGSGFYDCKGIIQNCIIWENAVPDDAQLFDCATPTYSCIQNWLGNGLGNITDEPQLVDPLNGDFHLQVTSPCIDAGCFVLDLTKDFEGDTRGFNGSPNIRGDGSDYDMGADEYTTINNSNCIFDNIPGEISLKKSSLFTIIFKNTGNKTWTTDYLYRLGLSKDHPPLGFPGRVLLPHNVAPGEEVTFSFWVCPQEEGEFLVSFQMLQEYIEWFGESVEKTIKVVKYTGIDENIFELFK